MQSEETYIEVSVDPTIKKEGYHAEDLGAGDLEEILGRLSELLMEYAGLLVLSMVEPDKRDRDMISLTHLHAEDREKAFEDPEFKEKHLYKIGVSSAFLQLMNSFDKNSVLTAISEFLYSKNYYVNRWTGKPEIKILVDEKDGRKEIILSRN